MNIEELLDQIKTRPDKVNFDDVMATIAEYYDYQPTRFTNGPEADRLINEAGTNEGSCRIFAFGKLNWLTEAETLACFGHYYRDDVLLNPGGSNHANIRTFMEYGWSEIHFDKPALIIRK